LGQLGNRVQHALRAFTAKDQKDLKQASETYRPNPNFKTEDAIRDVGTGEAVTSFLEAKGIPSIVERTLIRPPKSQLGPIDPALRAQLMVSSGMGAKYNTTIDRESAYEKLRAKSEAAAREAAATEEKVAQQKAEDQEFARARRYEPDAPRRTSSSRSDSLGTTLAKSFVRQLGTRTGQAVVRGILGSIFKR
jgi:hypothetical protein